MNSKYVFVLAAATVLSMMTVRAHSQTALGPADVAAALPNSPGYVFTASGSPDGVGEASSTSSAGGEQQADPHASSAGAKGHTDSGEPKQTKRILGVVPNFSAVSANERLPPMTVKEKFLLAGRNSFDYSSFVLAAVQAGFAMGGDSYPEFHQGVVGYGRYYWHTLADTADENFMVGGLLPMVTREDPRFYTLGHGSFGRRALYASTRVLQTRADSGNETVNLSEIIGAGAAAGVSSLYYPTHYRTWTKVGQKWLTSGLIDGANYTFKEFWPDINHKLFHTHD